MWIDKHNSPGLPAYQWITNTDIHFHFIFFSILVFPTIFEHGCTYFQHVYIMIMHLLVLLDCVSRDHNYIKIPPWSVCRPSVVCGAIILVLVPRISFKFCFLVALGRATERFLKTKQHCFVFNFSVFVNAGSTGDLLLNFLFQGPYKNALWNLWILQNEILTILFSFSLTWDPMGVKMSKRCSTFKSLSIYMYLNFLLNFLLDDPHKSTDLDCWNFEFAIFKDFFRKFHFHHCYI